MPRGARRNPPPRAVFVCIGHSRKVAMSTWKLDRIFSGSRSEQAWAPLNSFPRRAFSHFVSCAARRKG
eukprot:8124401-Pyramimonas_sp.AAC.1